MERRKLLLGTGVTLTAAVAGCLGGDDGNDSDEESSKKDDDGGDNGGDGGDETDVPGVDSEKIEHRDDVKRVKRDGKTVAIEVEVDVAHTDDYEKLARDAAADLREAVTDVDRMKKAIDRIEVLLIDARGTEIAGFFVDVEYVVAYLRGDLDHDEFRKKMKQKSN